MNSSRVSHIQALKSLLEKEEQQYEFVKGKSKELYSNFSDSDKTFFDVFTYLKAEDLEYCYYKRCYYSHEASLVRSSDPFVELHNNFIDVLRIRIKEGWGGFGDWKENQGVFVNGYKITLKDKVLLSHFALEFVQIVRSIVEYKKYIIDDIENEISFLEEFERKREYIEELRIF